MGNILFCSRDFYHSFLSHAEPASLIYMTHWSLKAIDLQSFIWKHSRLLTGDSQERRGPLTTCLVVSALTTFMPSPIALSFYLSFALFLSLVSYQQAIDQRELDNCLSFQDSFLFFFLLYHPICLVLILYPNVV